MSFDWNITKNHINNNYLGTPNDIPLTIVSRDENGDFQTNKITMEELDFKICDKILHRQVSFVSTIPPASSITFTGTGGDPIPSNVINQRINGIRIGRWGIFHYSFYKLTGSIDNGDGEYRVGMPPGVVVDTSGSGITPNSTLSSDVTDLAMQQSCIGVGHMSNGSRGNATCFLVDSTRFRVGIKIGGNPRMWSFDVFRMVNNMGFGFTIKVPLSTYFGAVTDTDTDRFENFNIS